MADRETGKITDGKKQVYRCFSATEEAAFPSVRKQRWHNFDLLRDARFTEGIYQLIMESLPSPRRWDIMRIHVGGDYFNLHYFMAWMEVAKSMPEKKFYAYTKSVAIVRRWLRVYKDFPPNFELTSSADEIEGAGQVTVVFHPEDAEKMGLEIDHDESRAIAGKQKFALLLHGTQPKDTPAAEAKKRLQREKIQFSYPSKK